MDWRVFVLLLMVKICYGENNTCKTNPNDDKCYCVLDTLNSTDNWHEAVSFCQDQQGILVDINSQDTNDFILSLMTEANVTDAWVGVKGNGSYATLVSDPTAALSYTPTWNTQLDSDKMCASVTNGGNWDAVECSGNGIQKSPICRMPQIDSSGYNIETGCPFNGFLHGSKCYQIFTWTTGKPFAEVLSRLYNTDFCNSMNLGGKLILPTSDEEFQFILKIGKLSGLSKFWIRVDHGVSIPNYYDYHTMNNYTYGFKALRNLPAPSSISSLPSLANGYSDFIKYVINVANGAWEKEVTYDMFRDHNYGPGVMCEFDVGTPDAAKPSMCPAPPDAPPDVESTDAEHTNAVSTTILTEATTPEPDESMTASGTPPSKGDVSTAADSTTAPKDTTAVSVATSAPTASEKISSPQGKDLETSIKGLEITYQLKTVLRDYLVSMRSPSTMDTLWLLEMLRRTPLAEDTVTTLYEENQALYKVSIAIDEEDQPDDSIHSAPGYLLKLWY